jgi:hypothetical protein
MIMSIPGHMIGNSARHLQVLVGGILLAFCATGAAAAASPPQGGGVPFALETAFPGLESTPTTTPVPRPLVPGVPPTPVAISPPGCCSYPGWSADSEWVLFIDAPGGVGSSGVYSIPRGGGPITKVTDRVGIFSPDWSLVAYPEAGRIYIERWQDGERWTVPSAGREIHFSPSARLIAWEIGSSSIQNPDVRVSTIWVSDLKGQGARELVTVHGGGLIGWTEGEEALIVGGRLTPAGPAGIWRIQVEDGAGRLLFNVNEPREALLSPDGRLLALIVAFETQPDRNGLWILSTNGDGAQRLELFGSYRWRSADQLILIPFDWSSSSPYLLQYDANSKEWWSLTSPRYTQIAIANNDWQISPDGNWMVYHSIEDQSLNLLQLPVVPGSS